MTRSCTKEPLWTLYRFDFSQNGSKMRRTKNVIAEAGLICAILVVVTITTAMAIDRDVGSRRPPSFDFGGIRCRMETLPHFKPHKSRNRIFGLIAKQTLS